MFGLRARFEFVSGGDVGVTKAAQLSQLLKGGLAGPGSTMVGDRAIDIVAGKTNALRAIGVLWGHGSESELADAGADRLLSDPIQLEVLADAVWLVAAADRERLGEGEGVSRSRQVQGWYKFNYIIHAYHGSSEVVLKPKMGLVTLGARDLARMIAFYRDGLGFPTHNYVEGDEMVMFRLEGTWLGLLPRTSLAADAGISAEGSGFSGVTISHNAPSKDAVDRVFSEALAAGATELKSPQDVFWGGYSGYFADPEGNLWEVAFNPFTDLTW
jgi:uncharacterized protein